MKIAFFNWRDIRNPAAGGAEVYVHQILKRLVEKGHSATLFSSSFPGSSQMEIIDGIEHIRYACKYLIYPKSLLCYKKHIRGKYDVIVESINGVPFFTRLFAKEPVVSLVHQLTRENWYSALPFPLAFLGYHLEDWMLSLYRNSPAVVPSASTRNDLEKLGFRQIHIVHGAAEVAPKPVEKQNAVLYLGRLTKSKRVGHALRAFSIISENIPDYRLWIAGSGPEEKNLVKLAEELGVSDKTRFLGKVDEETKSELLSKAKLLLFPAVREGWGLVTLEANACSTPVIGYDVPGLHDSIKDGINGCLVPDGDLNGMARSALGLLSDKKRLKRLSASSLEYSKRFSWDKSAEEFESVLEA
ncbi:glycosyltransferase, partial [Candidatus Micrarchaeota archaeon]|nr:glycosyltransferase [Candidatus Micrarchaeota archaeon]